MYENSGRSELRKIKLTFFSTTGVQQSVLTANEGTYLTRSNTMEARGNVIVVKTDGSRLTTSVLRYDQAKNGDPASRTRTTPATATFRATVSSRSRRSATSPRSASGAPAAGSRSQASDDSGTVGPRDGGTGTAYCGADRRGCPTVPVPLSPC